MNYVKARVQLEKKNKRFSINKYIKTPKGTVLIELIILLLIASFHSGALLGFRNAFLGMVTGLAFDFVIALIMKRGKRFSDGGMITGLIIVLVLSPFVTYYIVIATTVIALASKHIFKDKRKPIFNPAAFGLLFAAVFFFAGQSWWGGLTMQPAWCMTILLLAGYFMTYRLNKFPQVFAFLGTYVILFTALGFFHIGYAGDALRLPFINCALFLAFFMMTDPPTSPARNRDQVVFGIITALVGTLIYVWLGGLTYLLVGLLTANGWKAWLAKRKMKERQIKAA